MRPEDDKKELNEMGKKVYEQIEIPAELGEVVNRAIASRSKEDVKKHSSSNEKKSSNVVRFCRYAAAAAAGLLVCLTVGVNTNEAFAMGMQELPVIGQLAKVLTVRSWHEMEGDYEYNVEVPEIVVETQAESAAAEDSAADSKTAGQEGQLGVETIVIPDFTADINAQIQQIVDDYIAQAQKDMADYKEAFFATGGTEEQWNDRTMDIYVDYNVKYHQGNILSLELITAKTWVSAQEERHYYNLDLENNTNLTLEQLLGQDYIQVASESIIAQIQERIEADENQMFFGYGPHDDGMIEGFSELSPDAMFYINENGNVVIVFGEYEIAPGYMGFPEFEITAQ